MKRSMFTSTFNPRSSARLGGVRYPVLNGGRHLSASPTEPPSITAAKAAMCSLGKEFQNLIDGNAPVKNSELAELERPFNEHYDNLIRQGESHLDIADALKACGVRPNIINELRPQPFWNPVTGLTAYGGTTPPPYVPPPTTPPPVQTPPTTSKPATPPPVERTPVETPSVTSGMKPWAPVDLNRSYDQAYSDYLRRWSEVNQPTTPTPTPTPPPQQPPTPPPVASTAPGCWYVPGKGYMWGPRPSGGESTGLSQSDCEALRVRDLEIRTGQTQVAQQTSCDPMRGEFYDPRTGQCRGSVASVPSIPFGESTTSFPMGMEAGSVTAASSFMGRRRGVHTNGNLEWWSYQQAFLPQLFFAKRRANFATLGVGKPVPPGLCCQATEDGGVICSNGQGHPPDCPNKPEPNVPGIAERIQQQGYLVPKPPPAPVDGVCPTIPAAGAPEKKAEEGGIPPLLGIAAVGAIVYALVESLS